jgi:hypothetical protein
MAQLFRSSAMRRFAGMTAVCLMIAIAFLSVMPPGDLPPVEGSDKLKHFIAYGSLGGAMAIAAGPGRALRAFLITIGLWRPDGSRSGAGADRPGIFDTG